MKILHLSDLHIGIKLYNYNLEEDQRYVFRQIIDVAKKEQPDAILIAGDVYDKSVPSADAIALFDWFVTRIKEAAPQAIIMMISGNHDSMQRIDCYRQILTKQGIYAIGMPPQKKDEKIEQITLSDKYGKVNFYLLPFVRPSFVKEIIGEEMSSHDKAVHFLLNREEYTADDRNVLVSHQFYIANKETVSEVERADNESITVGNIDSITADCLESFDYVALGHLHKPMKVGRDEVRYCGTPMAYSLSEEGQEKHALLITMNEKGLKPKVEEIPLLPLRKVRTEKGTMEEILQKPSEDYVRVILTEKPECTQRDLQNKLYEVFPNLLTIQMDNHKSNERVDLACANVKQLSPLEIVQLFYDGFEDEDMEVLTDVLNCVEGVGE